MQEIFSLGFPGLFKTCDFWSKRPTHFQSESLFTFMSIDMLTPGELINSPNRDILDIKLQPVKTHLTGTETEKEKE